MENKRFVQVFIKSESDLPKEGMKIDFWDKDLQKINRTIYKKEHKKVWLNSVSWYYQPLPEPEVEGRTADKSEDELDLIQYVTNLLYDALKQGFELRHYANIGEGFRNADTGKFDKWVKDNTDNLTQYYASQFRSQPEMPIDKKCNHVIGANDESGKCFKCGETVSITTRYERK